MSGSIQNTNKNLTALSKTKIWTFVSDADNIVKPDSTKAIISTLKEKGANARITILQNATHFEVPAIAYKNLELIGWLVSGGE